VPFVLLAFGRAEPGPFGASAVASHVDIAPTLLRGLDMPLPPSWEGQPLQDAAHARIVYFQQGPNIGLVDSRVPGKLYKHWLNIDDRELFTFDLFQDPGEKQVSSAAVADPLRQEWQRLLLSRSGAISVGGQRTNPHLRRDCVPAASDKSCH
jgi:arylsulfatase A-like enzyme